MSRLQKKPPAHKRGHPTLQNMNFFYFCGSFLPSWIQIRIRIQITDPDPDPMVRLNTDPDPDPKHWFISFAVKIHRSTITKVARPQLTGSGEPVTRAK
jgi:hypothetical protein